MKKILQLLAVFVLITHTSFSQSTTIKGAITDGENNQPIAGANILIKGKIAGTVTDANGNFELNTSVKPPLILTISMIGYQRQEVEVQSSEQVVNVKLPVASELMDEIVFAASRVDENILQSPV